MDDADINMFLGPGLSEALLSANVEEVVIKAEPRGKTPDGKNCYQITVHAEEELKALQEPPTPQDLKNRINSPQAIIKNLVKGTYKVAKGKFDLGKAVFLDPKGKQIDAQKFEEIEEEEFILQINRVSRQMLIFLGQIAKEAKERQEAAEKARAGRVRTGVRGHGSIKETKEKGKSLNNVKIGPVNSVLKRLNAEKILAEQRLASFTKLADKQDHDLQTLHEVRRIEDDKSNERKQVREALEKGSNALQRIDFAIPRSENFSKDAQGANMDRRENPDAGATNAH